MKTTYRHTLIAFLFTLTALAAPTRLHAQPPTITSFTPASGSVGTLVTVTGTNLSNPTAFSIGGKTAIVISNRGSSLVGMVMPGAATGVVAVSTTGGTVNSSSSFTVTATSFPSVQQGAKLVGTGNIGAAQQGTSVSVSADGNTAIVGGSHDDSCKGAVWIYTRNGGLWNQQGAKLVGTGSVGDSIYQGYSVSLNADGNTAIVGGEYDNFGQGAAWVFTRSGSTWIQQGAKLVGTGNIAATHQGTSVSLSADGNTAIVGGFGENFSFEGGAWIFTRSGGIWAQQGNKLVGTGGNYYPQQVGSVSLSGDGNTAIIGVITENAAWVQGKRIKIRH